MCACFQFSDVNGRKWHAKQDQEFLRKIHLQLNQKKCHQNGSVKSVATGSWGCGRNQLGDAQFKVIIQWLAASVANLPILIYYTCSNENLAKLDTVVRVLNGKLLLIARIRGSKDFFADRKWTVGELLRHTLFYAKNILNNPTANYESHHNFFDKLIGLEKVSSD
jgi:poly(ADP-ribose) glycohydrolase